MPFCSRLVPSGARAAFCCCCTWNMFGVVLRRGCAGPGGAHGVSLVRPVEFSSVQSTASWSCVVVQLRGATQSTSMHAITVARLRQTRQGRDAGGQWEARRDQPGRFICSFESCVEVSVSVGVYVGRYMRASRIHCLSGQRRRVRRSAGCMPQSWHLAALGMAQIGGEALLTTYRYRYSTRHATSTRPSRPTTTTPSLLLMILYRKATRALRGSHNLLFQPVTHRATSTCSFTPVLKTPMPCNQPIKPR